MNETTRTFIINHANDDVFLLSMQAGRFPDVDMSLAVRQINGRKKIRDKVPVFFRNDHILFPQKLSIEQSSSQFTAEYKKSVIESGDILADLTGGFGVDFYFLSSLFRESYYVESSNELCELAQVNFKSLNINLFHVYNETAEQFLKRKLHADCIFIDPHRRDDTGRKMVSVSDCSPDVSQLAPVMLQLAPTVLIKLSPMLDIKKALDELIHVSEVHVVAVNNECKELLYKLQRNYEGEPVIYAVNLNKSRIWEKFSFCLSEESQSESSIATSTGKFLYEPNAAILKSGAFKLLCKRFGLNKLHVSTHLYTSELQISDFPGRSFEIVTQYGCSKGEMKKMKILFPQANVSCRNFPLNPQAFRNKYNIADGGDIYIFATTLSDGSLACIVCRKTK
jgi:hypothetical protein